MAQWFVSGLSLHREVAGSIPEERIVLLKVLLVPLIRRGGLRGFQNPPKLTVENNFLRFTLSDKRVTTLIERE